MKKYIKQLFAAFLLIGYTAEIQKKPPDYALSSVRFDNIFYPKKY
ncbi:hypothetical protein SAMN04488514_1011006 [Kriegella aquimaris]|uniref:Uncharacterized protein n=1 Tax=Kriegella aquimaris TaxID=192904 RepID=A0A1G9KIT6_9FLAO|nr:hypothetical protein SAMN04488514_1011006 [Kriegella aquimaris]